ncbi:hypothetical protein BBP00_00009737, partial [Phytophthora kernoviae]
SAEETKAPKTKKTKKTPALIIDSSDDSASAEETKAPKTKKTKKTKVPATTEPASLDISDSASGSSADTDALLALLASMDLSGSDDSASAEETKAPKTKKTKTPAITDLDDLLVGSDDSASAEETKAPKAKKTKKTAAPLLDESDSDASDASDTNDLTTTPPSTAGSNATVTSSGGKPESQWGFWPKVGTWWKGLFKKDEPAATRRLRLTNGEME